jgi:hypothetical protein
MGRVPVTAMLVLLLLLLASGIGVSAQAQPACEGRVAFPVVPLDDQFQFISNLEKTNFRIEINRREITPTAVQLAYPENVVFFLDSGPGSWTTKAQREYALRVAFFTSSAAPASSAVSMIVFGEKIEAVIEGRDAVQKELMARLSGQDPKLKGSNPLETVERALESLNARPGDSLFVITSGNVGGKDSAMQERLLAQLQKKGVRLFLFTVDHWRSGFGSDGGTVPQRSGGTWRLVNLAYKDYFRTPEEWKDRLISLIYRSYLVQLEVPPSTGSLELKLKVENLKALGRKNGRVYFPTHVYPCPNSTP